MHRRYLFWFESDEILLAIITIRVTSVSRRSVKKKKNLENKIMCEIDGYMNYIVFVSMLDLSGCGSLVVDVFSVWKW